jgi:alpha-beta hydrolase superfamily lysophospholipase
MALNAIDGVLADEFLQKSPLGAYLNELCDAIADACCYLPFAFLPEFDPLWIGAAIVLALTSEMAGAIGPMIGAVRTYDGPMGKSDRALVFGALAAWIGAGGPLGHQTALIISVSIILLLGATIISRVTSGLADVEGNSEAAIASAPIPGRLGDVRESFFETHDGARLYYRYWPARTADSRKAVVLLHRGHEHSGRLAHLVDELDLPDFAVFAWDARGHGHSAAHQRNPPSLGTFVKDLDCFVRRISQTHYIAVENIAIVSQSVGSVLAATWAHDYAPNIRSMVLVAPAFKVKLYVPFARVALSFLHRIFGDFHVNSYVRAKALTHDPERIASYDADPFITRPIAVRVLLGLYGTSDRIVADAHAIQVPTQILIAGQDWVVHRKPQLEFFDRLGTVTKERHLFQGFYHDILGEKERRLATEKVRQFILRTFSADPQPPGMRVNGRDETTAEFEALRRPLPPLSPKRIGFALTRVAMRTGGRLSDGIRLGLETGFDSGSSLDYVYRNEPSGTTPLGTFIDRCYLNSTGWRGVRVRKENVIRALQRCIANLQADGKPVRIFDVAAGCGRYVLEAIEPYRGRIDDALMRDSNESNLRRIAEVAKQRDFPCVRVETGDAFDRGTLSGIRPLRTLGIVSGLYELFPENQPVRQSLAGLAEAIEPGGFLVYTGQPFHPQLEFIARTLPNRERRAWIMRRRTQAELDQLVEESGFRKIEEWIDDGGIFSVSIAQRIA